MACEDELERLEAARQLLKDLTDYQNASGFSKLACAIAWFLKYGLFDPSVNDVNQELLDAWLAYKACRLEAGLSSLADTLLQNPLNIAARYI